MLKSTVDIHFPFISKITNFSYENGCFPDELKLAEVSPIFKLKDDVDKKNYRPVSIYFICQRPMKELCKSKLILS